MCLHANQFVCMPCYCYARNKRDVSCAGRHVGIFGTSKAARSHVKSVGITHKSALAEYRSSLSLDHASLEHEYVSIKTNDTISEVVYEQPSQHYETIQTTTFNMDKVGFDCNSKSLEYYAYEAKSPGLGAKYLLGKAFHHPKDKLDDITIEEVTFFLKMALLLSQLTQQQQTLLADILLIATNSKDAKLSIFKTTRVPTTTDDFNSIFLSKKNAIIPNLPHPVIKTTKDGTHAYVSLVDVVANELANATTFDDYFFSDDNTCTIRESGIKATTVSRSESAKKLFFELYESNTNDDTHVMYLWLKEWRDTFDPNNTKSSRNQVWINTFTISPPNDSEKSGRNTFFMSLSSKSDNHDEIDNLFGNEIKEFSTNGHFFYHGGRKQIIKVKLGKLITCVDRPERASMFQVGDHNGKFSCYWGHAGHIDGSCAVNCLPSCQKCRKKRLQTYISKQGTDIVCINKSQKCSNWNVFGINFSFPKPANYPEKYDLNVDAPIPPTGREIINSNKTATNHINKWRKTTSLDLSTVKLSIPWLEDCIRFAFHNVKTLIPSNNKRHWTKGNFVAYLRSCGISSELINKNYTSAINGTSPIFPTTWIDKDAMAKCHYAGMHMIFLGHVKSNFDMISEWLSKRGINAVFGKQANVYLELVKKLRVSKHFAPHSLSVTKWGTGNWVSENYVFLARILKFLMTMPAVCNCKWMANADEDFISEYKCILRFVSASNAMLSRIMSCSRVVADMDLVIKIYMDCMVEIDREILGLTNTDTKNQVEDNDNNDKEKLQQKRQSKKQPNFVKSNSLGMLCVAQAHQLFGPLILNWEGGYAGERKIQEIKPLLTIKRENADWQRLTLQRIYQLEAINKVLDCVNLANGIEDVRRNRESDGLLKVFQNKELAMDSISKCQPLSAMVDGEGMVWIAFRPNDGVSGRSAVSFIQIVFDDDAGEEKEGLCWTSPIKVNCCVKSFDSMADTLVFVREYALLLPLRNERSTDFINMYYTISHNWTERKRNGLFEYSELNTNKIFSDWNKV